MFSEEDVKEMRENRMGFQPSRATLSKEDILAGFIAYVEDDLAVAETDYVLDKLYQSFSEEEIKELGFGYLIKEDYYD